jgi:lysozyme
VNFLPQGTELLKQFEGLKLQAYQDQGGVWTIGYGHTGGILSGMTIDNDLAEKFLAFDTLANCALVKNLIHPDASDFQFTAAVCFAFNVRGWQKTPLFALLASGKFEQAKNHWLLYDHVTDNGEKIEDPGLKNRRQAELDLFCQTA